MKKLFTLLIMMCLTIGASAIVKIGGKDLASGKSFDNSSGVGITAGKISLSGTTLTLDGVTMTVSEKNCISNTTAGLKVVVKGTNKFTSVDRAAFVFEANSTITRNNSDSDNLTVVVSSTENYEAIRIVNGYSLTIDDVTVNATGIAAGICGYRSSSTAWSTSLILKNATVTATSSMSKGAVWGIKTLTLEGTEITSPTGAAFRAASYAVCTSASSTTTVKDVVKFTPVKYPVYVKGIQVTYKNKGNILGDGKVKFLIMSSYYELLCNNATIDGGADYAVRVREDIEKTFYLTLKGANKFTSTETDAVRISSKGSVIIDNYSEDNASATFSTSAGGSSDGICVDANATQFTIGSNVNITASATNTTVGGYGIRSNATATTILKSTVKANGRLGAFHSNAKPALTGVFAENWCEYNKNVSGFVSYNDRNSTTASLSTSLSIIPGEDYGVRIGGYAVNSTNYSTINTTLKNKGIVTAGTVSYIVGSGIGNYVQFDGVTAKTSSNMVWSKSDVQVLFKNTNSITTTSTTGNYSAFVSYGSIYARYVNNNFPAVLNVSGTTSIFDATNNLTFERINVTAKTTQDVGIYCGGAFKAISSNVDITSSAKALTRATSFTLDGSYILVDGGKYDTSKKYFVDNSGAASKTMVINKGYGIKVAGTDVTKDNYSNVLGDGKVSYNISSKTLTLNNATLSPVNNIEGIYLLQNANVKLVGTNNINAAGSQGTIFKVPAGITTTISSDDGKGVLNLNTTAGRPVGLYTWGTTTISNCTVNAKGNFGISGEGVGSLTIDNATVTALGASTGSIYNLKALTLKGVEIASPTGAKFNTSTKRVEDASGTLIRSLVTIKNVTYGIEVGGKAVTSANKDNIPVASGTVKFDPATSTLTLNNATITPASGEIGIDSEIPITISLVGTSKITTTGDYGICSIKDMTIKSASGSNAALQISNNSYGIVGTASTTIKDCNITVNCTGNTSIGLWGGNSSNGKMTINNAIVDVNAKSAAAKQFAEFTLVDVGFAKPISGKYNSSTKRVEDAKGNIATELKTDKYVYYDISIAGTDVTSLNCTDIMGDGTVSYVANTNTLTLNNANIKSDNYGMSITTPINIVLSGKNTITSTSNCITAAKSYINIDGNGTGSLTLKSSKGTAINALKIPLTIKNCTIEAEGQRGIQGDNANPPALTITKSNVHVKATGSGYYAMFDLSGITLTNCYVESPAGAAYNSTLKGMASGGKLSTEVTIKSGTDPKTVAPTVSNKTIKVDKTDSNSITISWTAAKDNTTAAADLSYEITCTKAGASKGKVVTVKGLTTVTIPDLEESTKYNITMKVTDADGNSTSYTSAAATTGAAPDVTKPTLPSSNAITVTAKSPTTISIKWNAATDDKTAAADLQYEVSIYVDGAWKTVKTLKGTTTCKIEGLTEATEYKINVDVLDESGNKASYKQTSATTTVAPDVTKPTLSNTGLILTNKTGNSISIAWTAATDDKTAAADLQYEVSIYSDGAWKTVATLKGATSYKFQDLKELTDYKIAVKVIDAAGNSTSYDELSVKTIEAEDFEAPALSDATLTVTEKDQTSISISWNAATDNKTAAKDMQYEVSIYANDAWTVVATVKGDTKYKYEGLTENTEYKLAVSAIDEAGNSSAYNELNATTEAAPDETAPKLPENSEVTVTDKTPKTVSISWNAATDDKTAAKDLKYEVNIYVDEAWKTVATLTGTTEYKFEDLDENTRYMIAVYAVDEAGNKSAYDELTVETPISADVTEPTRPENAEITVTDKTAYTVSISWEAATDDRTAAQDLKYEVNIYVDGGWKTVATLTGTTEYKIEGLAEGTYYMIAVNAIDQAGNSVAYDELTVETPVSADTTEPTRPENAEITVTNTDANSISISWNPATDDKTAPENLIYSVNVYVDGGWTTVASLVGTTEYTITNLAEDTYYMVAISAIDEAGNSVMYDELTVTTAVGIEAVLADNPDAKIYNLAGHRVTKSYKGVVIINGNKYYVK